MKRILLVGENPFSQTGNGNMMAAILSTIDTSKYQITCFAAEARNSSVITAFRSFPFAMIDAQAPEDPWGAEKLLNILQSVEIDVLLMVGIDLWQYAQIFEHISTIRNQKGFKWGAIFPYDLQEIRSDWIAWMSFLDYPCVYSQYGFDMLKDHVSGIRYFRPPLHNLEIFQSLDADERIKVRRGLFQTLRDDDIVFGFVGANIFRKDIPRFVKAFMWARQEISEIKLYLHTELSTSKGVYNLQQMALDYGGKSGDLLAKEDSERTSVVHMARIYNIIDCLVNCTMQEGLSWTLLEAMVSGTPVIASDTTAQTELVKDVGLLVPCEEQSYIPMVTESGQSFVDAKSCKVEDIRDAIIKVAKDPELRKTMRIAGLDKARKWIRGVSNINDLLADATKLIGIVQHRINKILFVQHSSAGDVLMSTQCFKGIKEQHKSIKLVYMTQSKYADIIEGNPYVDEIIEWNSEEVRRYEIVYNPHEERILPGNFNSGNVPLHAMYPYFCRVEADDMFIEQVKPLIDLPEDDYIVIQSSGGVGEIRTYKHMDLVLKKIGIPVAHIGSAIDMACHEATYDLRGKLSWRETAWVMAKAKAAVVMDSFPAHLAGALGTPVVVLYGPAPARVTGCKGNHDKIINLEPNWLDVCPVVAACYGRGNCSSPCINSINPMTVRKSLCEFL